jgi:hypothetical protein
MEMVKRTAVAVLLMSAPAAFAQTYIVPTGDCGSVTLNVTRGADFPNLGQTIAADRVTNAYVYLPKERVAVKPADARSLTFTANVPDAGVVMAAVDLKPEISGNETRTEHAKALIFCGTVTPAADWQRSTGLDLEIYPQAWNGSRPHMRAGDPMRFIAVDKSTNKMIDGVPMQLFRAGAGHIADGVPAQYGGMKFPYPEPGRYMVVTTYRRPDPKQPENWLVDTSTLTFDIK